MLNQTRVCTRVDVCACPFLSGGVWMCVRVCVKQVIGARVVIEDADNLFVTDPEGQSVTTAINDKLPNTVRVRETRLYIPHTSDCISEPTQVLCSGTWPTGVECARVCLLVPRKRRRCGCVCVEPQYAAPTMCTQVLSVQRVNKKFNARRFCKARSYEYLLPAGDTHTHTHAHTHTRTHTFASVVVLVHHYIARWLVRNFVCMSSLLGCCLVPHWPMASFLPCVCPCVCEIPVAVHVVTACLQTSLI